MYARNAHFCSAVTAEQVRDTPENMCKTCSVGRFVEPGTYHCVTNMIDMCRRGARFRSSSDTPAQHCSAHSHHGPQLLIHVYLKSCAHVPKRCPTANTPRSSVWSPWGPGLRSNAHPQIHCRFPPCARAPNMEGMSGCLSCTVWSPAQVLPLTIQGRLFVLIRLMLQYGHTWPFKELRFVQRGTTVLWRPYVIRLSFHRPLGQE